MSIKTKIMLPMVVITIVIAAAILVSNIFLFNDYVSVSYADSVDASAILANDHIESRKREASLAGMLTAGQMGFIEAVAAKDREALVALGQQIQADTGVEFVTVTDASGVVIARSHEPENYGDSITNQDNIVAALDGRSIAVIEPGTAVVMSIRSASPVYDAAGSLIGVVSVGYRLDTNEFVDAMKNMTANETTVFLGDTRISTTVINPDGTRATGTKVDPAVYAVVSAGQTYFGEATILGRAVLGDYMPLTGADGSVLGIMFSGKYMDEANSTIFGFVRTGVLIVVGLLIVSVLLILYITRRIVAPIYVMSKAALEMADGNTNIDVKVETKDEMRVLGDAFERMIVDTRKQVDAIESIARGDLTVRVKARSEKDVMNHALMNMLQLNNSVFSSISSAANQVSIGSQHIADSSQNLAQGATEQAATVEELSASIAEISDKTKVSASMAGDAAKLADAIKENAENGSRQMDEMISAVKAINDSSHDISRVIKVIDDIAFQTNILALNAAVEAARAGQHGKGFTVVADEVRSLASKSAEAAKNTGAMIQDSIEKAELGSRIASETAESLAAIISGIQESDKLISEIAISSQEQALSIAQVNDGVDQVAQVVQQNSATAEENAAASEEMSSQSSVLKQMIGKFQLAEDATNDAPGFDVPQRTSPVGSDMDSDVAGFSLTGNQDSGKY